MNKRNIFLAVGAVIYAITAIIYSNEIAQSIRESINHCLSIIIPALYAFMIASSLFVSTGLSRLAGYILNLPAKIFGISGELMSVFMISQIGGYPCGAIMLSALKNEKRITKKNAELMQYCCFGSGPAFFYGIVAGVNPKAQLCIFLSMLTINVFMLFLISRTVKLDTAKLTSQPLSKPTSASFTVAVCSAASSLVKICAMIIAFSSIKAAISAMGIKAVDSNFIGSIWEISHAGTYFKFEGNLSNIAGLLSFGGICVILQLASINKEIKIPLFIAVRGIAAIATTALCHIYINFLCKGEVLCFASAQIRSPKILSIIPSIFLFIMTMLLLSKKGWTNDGKSDII